MNKDFYWWSGIVIVLVALVAFLVVDSQKEIKTLKACEKARIIPLPESYFTWEGILDLNKKGQYQPKCL